jgi:hypothetical protein
MNMLKLTAAAALVAASLSASAMTTIADEDLSAVSGQDGVSIAANLNINIGSFQWGNNKDAIGAGAAISFDNIQISGLVAMTIDVISGSQFNALYQGFTGSGTGGTGTSLTGTSLGTIGQATTASLATAQAAYAATPSATTGAALVAAQVAAGAAADTTATFYNGKSDVVQFAFPNVKIASSADLINISVQNITLGTNGANASATTNGSFGSFAINGLDLRGTSVWMWAH